MSLSQAAPDIAVPMASAKQSDSSQSPHQKATGQQLRQLFDGQTHNARPQHHTSAAGHAELEKLTQQLEKAEQRAIAAELATGTIQRAHTEAVEQSTRLQAGLATLIVTSIWLVLLLNGAVTEWKDSCYGSNSPLANCETATLP